MLLQLNFSSDAPIYQQIRNQVVTAIASGELKPGERLPTIRALAEEKQCYFLDVAACLTGPDGVLPVKQTTDGIHFNTTGCKAWLHYLRTHSLEPEAIARAQAA